MYLSLHSVTYKVTELCLHNKTTIIKQHIMLTHLTQTAIGVLYDISFGEITSEVRPYTLCPSLSLPDLLNKLESAGIIRLIPGQKRGKPRSYRLTRPATAITLLDVLQATGEHLDCNHDTCEELYQRYGHAARKLGIINQMTRTYLTEIKLADL